LTCKWLSTFRAEANKFGTGRRVWHKTGTSSIKQTLGLVRILMTGYPEDFDLFFITSWISWVSGLPPVVVPFQHQNVNLLGSCFCSLPPFQHFLVGKVLKQNTHLPQLTGPSVHTSDTFINQSVIGMTPGAGAKQRKHHTHHKIHYLEQHETLILSAYVRVITIPHKLSNGMVNHQPNKTQRSDPSPKPSTNAVSQNRFPL
jgi:hypothetical protein